MNLQPHHALLCNHFAMFSKVVDILFVCVEITDVHATLVEISVFNVYDSNLGGSDFFMEDSLGEEVLSVQCRTVYSTLEMQTLFLK